MSKLSKAYRPQEHEDKIYQKWEKSGYFNPDNLNLPDDAPSYTIVLPPPNITDKLHLGHSSMLAIEDLLIRFHRMNGYRTLWIPGTDHAAIATQNVVEKKLLREKNLTRHDLGREKFLEKVWEFLRETQNTILKQTRKMGASLDWSRESFTLDKQRQKAVTQMFVDMYKEGVIYRGERIVNWCPRCHSTLADDEVEHAEQRAKFYTFKYWKGFPISISTTRPETKIGDTAVAVNPKDGRYQKYIGQEFEGNFCGVPLKIKIIADREVDMNLGTGALGVTPAHSMVDWKMAEDNKLEIKKVIDEDGKIHQEFGEFSGLTAKKAGELIIKKLKANNLLEKEEEIDNALSTCYRCDTAIEPLPSKQWFVSVNKKIKRLKNKSLREKAIEVVRGKEISFIPGRFEKQYINWMENLHDWCISRQIWFGHQIPVWYKNTDNKHNKRIGEEIYVGITPPKNKEQWTQDPDVLDTWFSSGMWTFSTLGWPDNFKNGEKTGDLAKFHPTQVLETGYEIITLWVSRMIMMSLFSLGEIPFENVYLHGMVLDEKGDKMSKSKGNGINPIEVINEFGTDAVRLSLLIGNTPGNNLRIGGEKIAGMRNLINKLWNITRYIEDTFNISDLDNNTLTEKISPIMNKKTITLADKWILLEFNELSQQITVDIKNYRFSDAGENLKDFTWNKLADWYLEISKIEKNKNDKQVILKYILKNLLILWHPFIPFVTENIWGKIFTENNLLLVEPWTKESTIIGGEKATQNNFNILQKIITEIRNVRAQYRMSTNQDIELIIYTHQKNHFLENSQEILKNLKTKISKITIAENGLKINKAHYSTINGLEIYIPLNNIINLDEEKNRLSKEIQQTTNFIKTLDKKLSNENFINNAPKGIIDKEKEKLASQKNKLKNLNKYLEDLT